ncbi:acyltransferase [Flavobacterium sp. LB1P71]|uniref:acyltransferase n=1 Tax=unclassified Flavobacterium TaxID=196869 RepID=UPI003AB0C3C5
MKFNYFTQQSLFIIRFRYLKKWLNYFNTQWLLLGGMKIGKGTYLPKMMVTWPHQVSLGTNCILEHGVYFKFDGIWNAGPSILIGDEVFIGAYCEFNISGGIEIGKKAMIASGCKFIDHDHGTAIETSMNGQKPIVKPIIIEEEVWVGVNCVVLKGVTIGKGAVVGAGSLVLKSIGENEIWGGVPAVFIKKRI